MSGSDRSLIPQGRVPISRRSVSVHGQRQRATQLLIDLHSAMYVAEERWL
jgi:hypothetical protein